MWEMSTQFEHFGALRLKTSLEISERVYFILHIYYEPYGFEELISQLVSLIHNTLNRSLLGIFIDCFFLCIV